MCAPAALRKKEKLKPEFYNSCCFMLEHANTKKKKKGRHRNCYRHCIYILLTIQSGMFTLRKYLLIIAGVGAFNFLFPNKYHNHT